MKKKLSIQQIRESCHNATVFSTEVLEWIVSENLWNLWVPKAYGGLEMPFGEGLKKLKSIAAIDGSLGWTVTLCSGANYFIGNLEKEVAQEIVNSMQEPICFGGSGGAFGTAEKEGNTYKINGRWHYATGAPYLSHFTINANIIENGKPLQNEEGSPLIRSFVLPRDAVHIVENWNTMGLLATATHSFDVREEWIDEKYSFTYNHFFLEQAVFKIPFSVFADLTLWVNYVGMGEHFLENASAHLSAEKLFHLSDIISSANAQIFSFAEEIEGKIAVASTIADEDIQSIHQKAVDSVLKLTAAIVEVYPLLGIKASREDQQINQIFRDYFTATQHHIFVDK